MLSEVEFGKVLMDLVLKMFTFVKQNLLCHLFPFLQAELTFCTGDIITVFGEIDEDGFYYVSWLLFSHSDCYKLSEKLLPLLFLTSQKYLPFSWEPTFASIKTFTGIFILLQGELNGQKGLVPSNFLEEVPDDVEVFLSDAPSRYAHDTPMRTKAKRVSTRIRKS